MADVFPACATIVTGDGRIAHYQLERRRRWNIGKRRHAMELTGRIVVSHGETYSVHDDWSSACSAAEKYATER